MDSSTNLPRKYFVVVTHCPALQLELETLLSSKRYNSLGTSQAKMFVENSAPPAPPQKLMEFIFPHGDRIAPPAVKHDTQRIVSTFKTEWQSAQFDARPNNTAAITDKAKESIRDDVSYSAAPPAPLSETWRLSKSSGALIKHDIKVELTGLESTLLQTMLHHDDRVVSKDDLIRSIGREPEHYRGLEMCLSRLQEKFKSASNGERLFRAVRNRGYCLIQKITRGKSLN